MAKIEKKEKSETCKHSGYLMKDGELVCSGCGEPSPSPLWRRNVFGAQSVESQAVMPKAG